MVIINLYNTQLQLIENGKMSVNQKSVGKAYFSELAQVEGK